MQDCQAEVSYLILNDTGKAYFGQYLFYRCKPATKRVKGFQ